MIAERESDVVIKVLMRAAGKLSLLLGEFMLRVCADRQRRLEPALARSVCKHPTQPSMNS
jgi:hypothetical protein